MTPEANRRILPIFMRLSGGPTGLGVLHPDLYPVILGCERLDGFLTMGARAVVHGMNAILRSN